MIVFAYAVTVAVTVMVTVAMLRAGRAATSRKTGMLMPIEFGGGGGGGSDHGGGHGTAATPRKSWDADAKS